MMNEVQLQPDLKRTKLASGTNHVIVLVCAIISLEHDGKKTSGTVLPNPENLRNFTHTRLAFRNDHTIG